MMRSRLLCASAVLTLVMFTAGFGCAPPRADSSEAAVAAESPGSSAVAAATGVSVALRPTVAATPLLDGTEKSIVLIGYSTSYAWPVMLQEMLDEHAGGQRTYHLLNAVIGGSPMGRWIAPPDSEDYQATYGAMLRDFFGPDARLRGDLPAPTAAMLQQSLQRTPTPETRLGPVTAVDDKRGIEIGADALEKIAFQLLEDGIERVHIGMHIYKVGYEPEVGNERFALEALMQRGHDFIFEGPDVWSLTIREHPAAFTEDGLHPNELGAKIMAAAWYRALAGDDAREQIVEAMEARSYDIDALTNEYLTWRRGGTP